MRDVNSLVIARDHYESQEAFEAAIKNAIMLLLNARYIMTVRYDEPGLGIVSIDYNHDQLEYGCDYPYWLSPTEVESIVYDEDRKDE